MRSCPVACITIQHGGKGSYHPLSPRKPSGGSAMCRWTNRHVHQTGSSCMHACMHAWRPSWWWKPLLFFGRLASSAFLSAEAAHGASPPGRPLCFRFDLTMSGFACANYKRCNSAVFFFWPDFLTRVWQSTLNQFNNEMEFSFLNWFSYRELNSSTSVRTKRLETFHISSSNSIILERIIMSFDNEHIG